MGNAAVGASDRFTQPRRRHLSDLYDVARYDLSFHSFEHEFFAEVSIVRKAHATNRAAHQI